MKATCSGSHVSSVVDLTYCTKIKEYIRRTVQVSSICSSKDDLSLEYYTNSECDAYNEIKENENL